MKYLTIALITVVLALQGTAHAKAPAGCVPAVQNWQNGSGYSCPTSSGGNSVPRNGPEAVPTILEMPHTDCAANIGCGGDSEFNPI